MTSAVEINNQGANTTKLDQHIEQRAQAILASDRQKIYESTDKLLGFLLAGEWLAGIAVAITISPLAWAGRSSTMHPHVIVAVALGLVIIALPLFLIIKFPGRAITRQVIAIALMCYSGLLIHLTGGRIETHFHIFGAIALLSFYRDWRVLLTATVVTAADHVLRGIYFPVSIYGVDQIQPWRWVEHAWWVVFEVAFLLVAINHQNKEMKAIAIRQAEVEETRGRVEDVVVQRTAELQAAEKRYADQLLEKEHLDMVIQTSQQPTIGQTTDGTIISWNKAAEDVFGFAKAEIVGQHIKLLAPSGKQQEMGELIDNAKAGQVVEMETTRLRKDGRKVDVKITRRPIVSADKRVIGVSEVMVVASGVRN